MTFSIGNNVFVDVCLLKRTILKEIEFILIKSVIKLLHNQSHYFLNTLCVKELLTKKKIPVVTSVLQPPYSPFLFVSDISCY